MDENGMTSAHELSEYYITKMADYLQQYHLRFSGWQEVALGPASIPLILPILGNEKSLNLFEIQGFTSFFFS